MSKDAAQFLKFLAALFIPALLAGLMLGARWANGSEWVIAVTWLASTLLAIGYVVDGTAGAKTLLSMTLLMWALAVIGAAFITWLAIAGAGHSL